MRGSILLWLIATTVSAGEPIRVGSKKFTESVILAEAATHLLRRGGFEAEHRKELGGTRVLWQALLVGDIDVYPEYVGTLEQDIARGEDIEDVLERHGLRMSRSLGFSDSYALGMKADIARKLGISRISDLGKQRTLRFGFSEEFRNRAGDGWGPLRRRYGLSVEDERVQVMDHDVAMRALRDGDLDVADVYTTEAVLSTFGLVALQDDKRFFPSYEAVWVYREALTRPAVRQLRRLCGRISESEMTRMNVEAQGGRSETVLADELLRDLLPDDRDDVPDPENRTTMLLRFTGEHLLLVGVSLALAIVVAVPLGVLASRNAWVGQCVLIATSVMQTIPSLALLVFLIPLLHTGPKPALAALFLYSLLPIVRNTHAGMTGIPPSLRESAQVLGLSRWAMLRHVELPLASRSILAGIKTAAIINVGNAVLGALIGAGGYGSPILTGIRLNDTSLILLGAVPAAVLAILVQGLFEVADRILIPKGLRLASDNE